MLLDALMLYFTKLVCVKKQVPCENQNGTGCQGLMPVILASQEAKIRRINIRSQFGEVVGKALPQVSQGVGPEFKPQY
jgi:hypothetical protein